MRRIKTRYIIRKLQCRHGGEEDGWITMNWTRMELEPGETPEEAGKRFAAEIVNFHLARDSSVEQKARK